MLVSAFTSLAGAYSQSKAIQARGDYQESISRVNAEIAGIKEKQAYQAGSIAASRQNLKTEQEVGLIKAAQGASGVAVGSGSSELTRIGHEFVGRVDEMTIRNNAARLAWGYKVQGMQDTYEGEMTKLAVSNQARNTLITGGLGAVEGPLSIYSKYALYSRKMSGTGSDQPFNLSTS